MKSMIKKSEARFRVPVNQKHGQNRGPVSSPIWSFSIQMPSQALSELCLRWWTKPCWAWFCSEHHTCDALISMHVGEHTHDALISMCVHEHTHDTVISMSVCEHTHNGLISMHVGEYTHDALISMSVGETLKTLWFQCMCMSTPMMLWSQYVCVNTSMTLWSQCNFEERITNHADRHLLLLLPHQINLFLQSKWC